MALDLADLKAKCQVLHDYEGSLLTRKLNDFEDGTPAALEEAVLKVAASPAIIRRVSA